MTPLRQVRQERGFSQRDLARRAHLTRNLVSRIELGYQKPSEKFVSYLCEALGVLPEEVGEFSPDPKLSVDDS
jgi:transcriptional regulator with XRE-family HTH domain